jgi:hypothetical protein
MSLNEVGVVPQGPAVVQSVSASGTGQGVLRSRLAEAVSPALPLNIRQAISREAILGHESAWQISDLGAVQARHGYDPQLLARILERALELKDELCSNKHLNLTYIRGAHRYIPEIQELANQRQRLQRLGTLAGTAIEPYPISVISSTITFMGPSDGDGTIDWHCDGVPVTELVPLQIDEQIQGGELELYLGNPEVGRAMLERGEELPRERIMKVQHKLGFSTLAQLLGVLHRTAPIRSGTRVTLNLNLRSVERPFVDDNRLFYLAADNDDDTAWLEEMTRDVQERQLPAYRRYQEKLAGSMAAHGLGPQMTKGKVSPSA